MFIHLIVFVFWFYSCGAGGQKLTELQIISDSVPVEDGQGRLMRLRTCREYFTVQCELCEVIHVVNASYAFGDRRLHRKDNKACSDIIFEEEFDCLHPIVPDALKEAAGYCDGNQSCNDLPRSRRDHACGDLVKTASCCLEVFYTCEERKGVALSLFLANDSIGNVHNVSLQCPTSDLSVVSIMLAFNSTGEFQEGKGCYKPSPNTYHVAKRCSGKGCSNVSVAGAYGCGGNKYTSNYGAYIYYRCNLSSHSYCETTVTTTTVASPILIAESTPIMWVIAGVLLVIAVLVSFIVGYIIGVKRRRSAKRISKQRTGSLDQKMGESRGGGDVYEVELKGVRHSKNSSNTFKDIDPETSQYCEINDLEMTVKQKSTDQERGRDNGVRRETGKGVDRGRVKEGSYPEPGISESKAIYAEIAANSMQYPNVIYAEVDRSEKDPTLVYAVESHSTEVSNPTYAELENPAESIKPVYKNVNESNGDPIPVFENVEPLRNVLKPVYANVDTPTGNLMPVYAKVNKSKTNQLSPASEANFHPQNPLTSHSPTEDGADKETANGRERENE